MTEIKMLGDIIQKDLESHSIYVKNLESAG